MAKQYWLVKSEPGAYSWERFVRDADQKGAEHWDGVRNYQARNNMRAMKLDDLVLFYHSVKEKRVVGVATVTREHYQDPTTDDERWSVVDLAPVIAVAEPVTLATIKAEPKLSEMALIKQSRLSVMPVAKAEFNLILKLAKTKMPKGR